MPIYRIPMVVLALVLLVGCAAFRNTLAQDLAYERWEMCRGKVPQVMLREIRSDGTIWWVTMNGQSATAAMNECLRQAAVTQRQRATTPGSNVVATPPLPSGLSSSGVAASAALQVPIWKIGNEWAVSV